MGALTQKVAEINANHIHTPSGWNNSAFLKLKALADYEVKETGWDAILD